MDDVIIVGGGAAGLSAALMLGRARRRVRVIDAGEPRNRSAAHLHGVLGHDGLDPADLLAHGRDEVARYGVSVDPGRVVRLEDLGDRVVATLDDESSLGARAAVIATGVRDELLDVPGLAERWGRTVLHCPYCHGWEVRDRVLGVLAASPMSLHQALLVRQWSDRVVVFADRLGPLSDEDRARFAARDVDVVESPVVAVTGEVPDIAAVRTEDGVEHRVDALFTGGALVPHDDFVVGLARTGGPSGDTLQVDDEGRTSSPRIWAAGDVVHPGAIIPLAAAAGAMVGARVNYALVEADFDRAVESSVAG